MATAARASYEQAVDELAEKYDTPLAAAPNGATNGTCGPRAFVESILELSDAFKERRNVKPFLRLRAGDLPDLSLLERSTDPWRELCVLYLRAFQSMYSRRDLKEFVIALGDGRFTDVPLDLARIKPDWCDAAHAMYAHCWRNISHVDAAASKQRSTREQALGRAVIAQVARASGVGASKAAGQIVERLSSHPPTAELVGRLARIMRSDNTSGLMNDAIAHAQALYTSGEIDMARLVREGIRYAQSNGGDPEESIAQVTGMLDKYGGLVASMAGAGAGR